MISSGYFDKLAKVESGDDPLAQNPKSSARGRYQFVNGTAKQYGLDQYEFGTPEYEKAEATAVKQFTQDNYSYLKSRLNREPTEGELYLAHQQGPGGAEKLLTTDQNQKAIDILGRDAVINNGGNEEMTIAEFSQKWTTKFDKNSENMTNENADAKPRASNSPEVGKIPDVDAFSDFGINTGNGDVDAFSDFGVVVEDAFLERPDGVGGIKKSMIDQTSGAPSYVRQVVGSLYDPESRLATLKKYYPDAQPYGTDNFVFTHPETKKPTLYNPQGADIGDVASINKEVFVAAGSGVGAFAGAGFGAAGGPAAPATIPTGAIIGAGLGAGIASNVYDMWMTVTDQTRDVRSFKEVAGETGAEVVGAALGQRVGEVLPGVIKASVGGAKATSRAILAQFERFGIRPSLAVTGGSVAGVAEAGLAQNIGSADVMRKQADEIIGQSHKALNKIIESYGKTTSKESGGAVIQRAAIKAAERLEATSEELYTKAYDIVGAGTPASLNNVENLQKELVLELAGAPEARGRVLAPALERVRAILADARGNGLDFQTLRSIRTDIGKDLKDPLSSGATASQNLAMKRLYAAMSRDMDETAAAVGPEALAAIKRADKYKRAYETTATEKLNKIMKYDAEEKAYKFALIGAKDGGSSLRKLRKLFSQDEWDEVASTVLSELGNNPATANKFSVDKFVTNYSKLSEEARSALFKGGKNQQKGEALDDFVDLMAKIKQKSTYENTSNTAGAIQTMTVLNSLGVGTAGFLAGNYLGVGHVVGMGLSTGGARMSAKLITNPEFVKWLAQPVKEGTKDWAAHLARLVAIGEANPEIKEAVNYLLLDMQKATAPENNNEKQR